MKRHMCAVVAGAAVLCLTACGGEEEVRNAATATIEQNGVTMTMSFDAKGDEVTRITQESVIDLSGYSEEMIDGSTVPWSQRKRLTQKWKALSTAADRKTGRWWSGSSSRRTKTPFGLQWSRGSCL